MGYRTIASGSSATAFGYFTKASGEYSTVFGNYIGTTEKVPFRQVLSLSARACSNESADREVSQLTAVCRRASLSRATCTRLTSTFLWRTGWQPT